MRLSAQYVSAPVMPEQPCVMTTAGTRSVVSGSLRIPKIIAGDPSCGAAIKGGVNRLPGKVTLWKFTISMRPWETAACGARSANAAVPTSTDDARLKVGIIGRRYRCALEVKSRVAKILRKSPMIARRIKHLAEVRV